MQQNLTIAIVDTAYHNLAAAAVTQAVEVTRSNNVLVLSDRNFYPGSDFIEIPSITDKRQYSKIMLKELGKHIKTDHFMVVQYDGMPTNADFWTDDYLKYDYIGAPWPWGPENRRVGNGGFCLRSRKLAELCMDDRMVFDPPGFGDNNYMEDTHICHMYRDWLESEGVQYAPLALATQFSAENPGGLFSTYGFHGTLCLPFYLTNQQLEYYINNLTERMFNDPVQIRILYGLFKAERYEHLEQFMDRATTIVPNFKEKVLAQFAGDAGLFPELALQHVEDLLINYV
jgi:hypothetical protein